MKHKIKTASVFDDLGFSPDEAIVLKMKSDLHAKIVRLAENYSQAQLQRILQEAQPRVSDLMRGKISKFSLDMLVRYASQLGMRPKIETAPAERVMAGGRFKRLAHTR